MLEIKRATDTELRTAKENWLDELRYKKIPWEKLIGKGKRMCDNAILREDEEGFYRKLNQGKHTIGTTPEMEKFVEFLGDIWEKEKLFNLG